MNLAALKVINTETNCKKTQKEKNNNIVNYRTSESGYYTTQTMYIISNIIAKGELTETNDTTNTYIFTNTMGQTKKHQINIEAYNRTSEKLKELANLGLKNIVSIVSESSSECKIIRKIQGEYFTTTITANENGYMQLNDEPTTKESKTSKDFGTI